MLKSWGADYAGQIRWRLGTEANGPRWTNHGEYESQYIECYKLTMERIKQTIPGAEVGVSNTHHTSLIPHQQQRCDDATAVLRVGLENG